MRDAEKLLQLLEEAATLVSGYSSMSVYCGHESGAEFAAELLSLRERIARKDWSALGKLVGIFAPTGAWDDGVGIEGMELANRIMETLADMDWVRLAKS